MLKAPRSAYLEYLDWLATAEPEPRVIASRQVARRMIAEMQQVASEPIDTERIGYDQHGHWHYRDAPERRPGTGIVRACAIALPFWIAALIWPAVTSRRGLTRWRSDRPHQPGAWHRPRLARHDDPVLGHYPVPSTAHAQADAHRSETETMTLTTTFKLLRQHSACRPRYTFLREALKGIGDNEPINLLTILETNGLDDALWAMRATEQDCSKIGRLMAADFAESVLPIWTARYPDDNRPALAIQAARDYAQGLISREVLNAAKAAAGAAAKAAAGAAARAAAWAAAWAAAGTAAGDAAGDAAWAAAKAAAWAAAWAAAGTAAGDAAGDAAWAAAGDAARAAARARQAGIFASYLQPESVTA